MARTAQQIIDIANASCVYASNELSGGARHGGLVDEQLPSLTYLIRQGYEWLYELSPSDEDLDTIGNYLIAISKFALKAENEITGGGSVTPITPNPALPQPIDWRVSGTATALAPLATGESSVVLDGTGGMPDLRGYNVDFFRNNTIQHTTDAGDGSTYYSWNRISGLFTLINGAAQSTELMRISPIG